MSSEAQPMQSKSPYDKLEAVTGTLEKERKFFEALTIARPVAIVVNRIIHLVTFYQGAERFIPPYLECSASRLFPNDSLQVAATLYRLLIDIARSARLAGYLCIKGIPEQALAVLRGAVEQIGVYQHVWHEPQKHVFVPDSDSEDYATAFRYTDDKRLKAELTAMCVKFRFMHCKAAKEISSVYELLSSHFVHGTRQRISGERQEELSCEFVDRDSPASMMPQFELIQSIMAMLYYELLDSIPKDDLLEDELVPLSIASGLLLPVVAFKQGGEMQELSEKMMDALRQVEFERGKE